ncbi:hypothetical protein LCGC14_2746600 [marine sediment metagenome]|uniref:Uncharacterized protein n=1 Tax=marine sediment metagenome TaxID=412755 RepID=A0A0F9BBR5_9ZZZZ
MKEKESIEETKELWGEIEKSGKSKRQFLASPAGKKWVAKGYLYDCPLCEYARDKKDISSSGRY